MVGDIIDLVEGMEIPADGVVLEASELSSDESAMTGETGKYIYLIERMAYSQSDLEFNFYLKICICSFFS